MNFKSKMKQVRDSRYNGWAATYYTEEEYLEMEAQAEEIMRKAIDEISDIFGMSVSNDEVDNATRNVLDELIRFDDPHKDGELAWYRGNPDFA